MVECVVEHVGEQPVTRCRGDRSGRDRGTTAERRRSAPGAASRSCRGRVDPRGCSSITSASGRSSSSSTDSSSSSHAEIVAPSELGDCRSPRRSRSWRRLSRHRSTSSGRSRPRRSRRTAPRPRACRRRPPCRCRRGRCTAPTDLAWSAPRCPTDASSVTT